MTLGARSHPVSQGAAVDHTAAVDPSVDPADLQQVGPDEPQVTVLHSLRPPTGGATRYVDQMVGGAPANVRVRYWAWATAIFGRYDVVHVHWPELLVRDRLAVRRFVKRRALDVLLARLAVQRKPLVWTAHNLEPHEGGSGPEQRALRRFSRAVDLAIRLNPTTQLPSGLDSVTILHGHYKDRFASFPVSAPEPGRLLYFGIIRPYKGVDTLIEAFHELTGDSVTLRVVGDPHPGQRELVEAAEHADPRISSSLRFVDDDELVEEVHRAQLVVLPYKEKMHNSGSVLVALSLGRPVLVPASETNEELAREVGDGWVIQYDGQLNAQILIDALERTRSLGDLAQPQLDGRDWDRVGALHYRAYRRAMDSRSAP